MSRNPIKIFRTDNGPCPYLEKRNWQNISFQTSKIPPERYTSLLNQGFRRSGFTIYHPVCFSCQECIPIRIDALNFNKNKGQRRTWRKNTDLRVEHQKPEFNKEDFALYSRYQNEWHKTKVKIKEHEYLDFLIDSPVTTEIMRYYLEDKLIGLGWVDRLPKLLSSVYFVFDPDYVSRRMGVFSLLYEIEYARRLDLRWLYLGYWVKRSAKMNYKADFQPAELLSDSKWIPFNSYSSK
tara:strand:+ start:199 stop:909 length:711 start_codon:yes stop_codon:yes gene_type:complete